MSSEYESVVGGSGGVPGGVPGGGSGGGDGGGEDRTIERQIAVFLSGFNAETIDAGEDLSPDDEGHILTAAVLRRSAVDRSMVPVRVRVAHGVASQTAAAMLRKMAEMLEREPGFLSSRPGTALRRMPDGGVVKKRLTPEGILAVADRLPEEDRERLMGSIEQIRAELTDGLDEGGGKASEGV